MNPIERALVVLAASALASVALVAAGCGGDSPSSGVAQAPTTSTATEPSENGDSGGGEFAFAACMRSHGVPDFPDPKQTSKGVIVSIPDDDSPQFRSALKSCRSLLPDGGVPSPGEQAQEREELLEFAACMRKNGMPDFPDPIFRDGQPPFPDARIDRSSPWFAAAKRACATGVTSR
jgi:hypothetical protein